MMKLPPQSSGAKTTALPASIIRRIDSVVRGELEKGGSLTAPKAAPVEPAVPADPAAAVKH